MSPTDPDEPARSAADPDGAPDEEGSEEVSAVHEEAEEQAVEDASGLTSRLIYEVIRRNGEEELARPARSLIWAGAAAGFMISFSVLGEAIFRTYLPDVPWRHLLENAGYSLGFMLVIMGRMQLFTENTITTTLPLMVKPCRSYAVGVAKLWVMVLASNVVGAFIAAGLWVWTPALPPEFHPAITELSHHATHMDAATGFFRAIPAGILVAALVWMLPQAGSSALMMILIFTWLIAAGDFTHIVAGSVEMAYLALQAEIAPGQAVFGFFLPVLAGNVIGGTAIFSLMAWGQVKDELRATRDGRPRPELRPAPAQWPPRPAGAWRAIPGGGAPGPRRLPGE